MSLALSFCIPTRNFGAFIGQTLDSIVRQASDSVEIVVVDGASTDNTPNLVREVQRSFPRLKYHRGTVNNGVDRDLARAVELAEGDYCWLLSSDDVLRPNAVGRMLDEIQRGRDLYLCNRTECTFALSVIRSVPWLSERYGDCDFDLTSSSGLMEYLGAAQSLGALFSYISSLIVSRKRWGTVALDATVWGTNYAHVFRIMSFLRQQGLLRYIREPLVMCRGRNDSFSGRGLVERLALDFNGYDRLIQQMFSDDPAALKAITAVVRREHRWYMLARARGRDRKQWGVLQGMLVRFGYGRTQLFWLGLLSACRPLVVFLRTLRGAFIGLKIAARKLARGVFCG
jgi:abequosyltransferase